MNPQTIHPKRAFGSRLTRVTWSEEQRLRVAGGCLAAMIQPYMGDEEINTIADVAWKATRALELRAKR